MSFFSFGKKDDAPSSRDAYSDSPRGSRQTVRTERLTRRSERTDADAMMLDPTLPERQRARRRLVGAVALVAAAVIVLPMVLDSHPKPVTDDIAIDIPARPAAPLPKSTQAGSQSDSQAGPQTDTATDTLAGVAPDSPPAVSNNSVAAGVANPGLTPAPKPIAKPDSKPAGVQTQAQTPAQAKAALKPAAKPSPPPATATATTAQATPAPKLSANTTAAGNVSAAAAKPSTPSSPAGSRFVLQIGTFDQDGPAQDWVGKLKNAGVPAYIEHRKQADGSVRTLLRAGPFTDRAAASAALVKVRLAGLGGGNSGGNSGGSSGGNSGSSGNSGNTSAN
jgi:DedD protein